MGAVGECTQDSDRTVALFDALSKVDQEVKSVLIATIGSFAETANAEDMHHHRRLQRDHLPVQQLSVALQTGNAVSFQPASRGGLGRLAVWHLPGGPVGSASRWAATSNVEVGQTTYPVNRVKAERGEKERGTKSQRGGDRRRD